MTLHVTKGGFLARTPFVLSPAKDIQPRPSYSHALMEVFSTPRLVPVAAARGLLAQHSLDKDSPAAWQADCAADRERARELVRSCRPYMLMLSPECTMYSIMQRNTNLARMDPAVVASRQQAADLHMKLCAELMVMQASAGRKFVLEWRRPWTHTGRCPGEASIQVGAEVPSADGGCSCGLLPAGFGVVRNSRTRLRFACTKSLGELCMNGSLSLTHPPSPQCCRAWACTRRASESRAPPQARAL